ncbi:hypothetical protein [Cytobacillus citreus]|nr:hypothetical protein [Cytobacillus citreus]
MPAATFWLIVPWPFIWIALGVILYFKLKKEDDAEESENNI